ncbi:5'/3'-nucleotidase SurE [Halobium salinum]|uniref:5'-nucleotidase SurE n=1 Tax=Halobium salinum TaxID=1364940 RepID=A0ABD5P7R0_9EURY|nr:5'/3'-nucleotidase SurE [Halobium salinum]
MGTTGTPRILLTNDDGIDAVGFRALYDALDSFAEVTAVAPADDQSAVGRKLSREADVVEHPLGYAVHGTPGDCVVAGLDALCPDADLVVAGCNKGANISAYVLGRSGTVSAAVESAFFGVPAIAVSMFVTGGDEANWTELASDPTDFRVATHAGAYLAREALGAGVFEEADYLNVNAPMPENAAAEPAEMVVTRPSSFHEMRARHEDSRVHLTDGLWGRMKSGDFPDPEGTDCRALVDGKVSVSPLTAPHTTERHEALDDLAADYGN